MPLASFHSIHLLEVAILTYTSQQSPVPRPTNPWTVLSTKGVKIDPLSPAQLKIIAGKIDFFSFDPYSAQYVSAPPEGIEACAADPRNPLCPACVVNSNIDSTGWLIGDAASVTYSFIAPQYVWNTFKVSTTPQIDP
jgi:hypothetical protein